MGVAERLAGELEELPPASAVAVQMTVDAFPEVLRGVLELFAARRELSVIYVTATIPSARLIPVLSGLGIDPSRLSFVDCAPLMMVGSGKEAQQVVYVESPTMLENIMLKIEYLLQRPAGAGAGVLVLIDSINTLAIHNNSWVLAEFLSILLPILEAKNASTVILALEEPASQELSSLLQHFCAKVLRAGGEEAAA